MLVIVAITKAAEGAWIIMLMIPLHVSLFTSHAPALRRGCAAAVAGRMDERHETAQHVVLVPMSGMQRAVVQALEYARQLSPDVQAVYVSIDPAATAASCAASGRNGARASRSWSSSPPIGR